MRHRSSCVMALVVGMALLLAGCSMVMPSGDVVVIPLEPVAAAVGPDAEANFNEGFAYLESGDPEKAIASFDKAIELEPDYALVYHYRGIAYHDRVGTYFESGDLNRAKTDLERSMADYDRAIELGSEDEGTYCMRGLAHFASLAMTLVSTDDQTIELGEPDYALLASHVQRVVNSLGKTIADYETCREFAPYDTVVSNPQSVGMILEGLNREDIEANIEELRAQQSEYQSHLTELGWIQALGAVEETQPSSTCLEAVDPNLERYLSPDGALAVHHPPEWVVDDDGSALQVVSPYLSDRLSEDGLPTAILSTESLVGWFSSRAVDIDEPIATGETGMMITLIPTLEGEGLPRVAWDDSLWWGYRRLDPHDPSQPNEFGTFALCPGVEAAYNALFEPSMTLVSYLFRNERDEWTLVKAVSAPNSDPVDPVIADVLRSITNVRLP